MSCDYFRFFTYVIISHHANLSKTGKHWGSFLTHCIAVLLQSLETVWHFLLYNSDKKWNYREKVLQKSDKTPIRLSESYRIPIRMGGDRNDLQQLNMLQNHVGKVSSSKFVFVSLHKCDHMILFIFLSIFIIFFKYKQECKGL